MRSKKGVIGALLVAFGFMLFAMMFLPVINELWKALDDHFMALNPNDLLVFLWRFLPVSGAVASMIGGVMLVLQARNEQGRGEE